MGKMKAKMLDYENAVFQQMQKQLFEELVQNGSPDMEFKPLNPYALGGAGQKAGNSFYSPSIQGMEASAVSKRETLILNAHARRNITTEEKRPKAGQFTKEQNTKFLLDTLEEILKKHGKPFQED